jgi:hypothetical protein
MTGPAVALTAAAPATNPWYMGTFSSLTIYETIPKAPWSKPDAPKPKKARPKIRIADDLAVAHMIDPTTNP